MNLTFVYTIKKEKSLIKKDITSYFYKNHLKLALNTATVYKNGPYHKFVASANGLHTGLMLFLNELPGPAAKHRFIKY